MPVGSLPAMPSIRIRIVCDISAGKRPIICWNIDFFISTIHFEREYFRKYMKYLPILKILVAIVVVISYVLELRGVVL